jgi:hypothetical protein
LKLFLQQYIIKIIKTKDNKMSYKTLLDYFYTQPKKKTLIDELMNDVSKELLDLTKNCLPTLQEEVKNKLHEAKSELEKNLTEENIKELVDKSTKILFENLKNLTEKHSDLEKACNITLKKK